MSRDAVIVSTARTGLAKSWKGAFNATHGATLGGHVVKAAAERARIDLGEIEDVVMGCATPEGATGGKTATQAARAEARLALQWGLYENLMAIVSLYPRQPEKATLYFQQHLLDHVARSGGGGGGTTPPPQSSASAQSNNSWSSLSSPPPSSSSSPAPQPSSSSSPSPSSSSPSASPSSSLSAEPGSSSSSPLP